MNPRLIFAALFLAATTATAKPPPRPLYPEPVSRFELACKPMFKPMCRLLVRVGVIP